jgi:hypothetical protein
LSLFLLGLLGLGGRVGAKNSSGSIRKRDSSPLFTPSWAAVRGVEEEKGGQV